MVAFTFGKIAKQPKNPSPLTDLIGKKFTTKFDKPPFHPHKNYIRCSSFASLCPREEVLCSVLGKDRTEDVDANLNLIFAHGSALHYIMQNEVLPQVGAIYGKWRCMSCGKTEGELLEKVPLEQCLVTRPEKCGWCDGIKGHNGYSRYEFFYEEVSLKSEKYRLTGHPDGFLKLPGYEGLGLLELKSISQKGAWEVKPAPKMDHAVQAQLYMWFTGAQWAQILYWDKSGFGTTALIEHHLERDDEVIEESLLTLSLISEGILNYAAQKHESLPDRICNDSGCPRAKNCTVVKDCFGAQDKASEPTHESTEPVNF